MIKILFLIGICSAYTILPTFDINLDGPARERWKPVVKYVLDTYGYDNSFAPVFAHHDKTVFNHLTPENFATMAAAIKKYYPVYAEELQGVQEALNKPEITFNYLAGWAYFHELSHSLNQRNRECTGILFQVGDKVIHGRNQDQQPDEARNLVVHLKFFKSGVAIGEAVDWYWFKTGLITAIKYNVASLEENWRTGNYLPLDTILRYISNGVGSLTWSFRSILENSEMTDFEDVVFYLENLRTASSLYNIVAGPLKNQGVIISRDPMLKMKTLRLGTDSRGTSEYQYLVQTNYDHWEADPKDDNRRTVAERMLAELQPLLINELGLYGILNSYPIHNEDTYYTTLSIPSANKFIYFGQEGIERSEV